MAAFLLIITFILIMKSLFCSDYALEWRDVYLCAVIVLFCFEMITIGNEFTGMNILVKRESLAVSSHAYLISGLKHDIYWFARNF